MNKIKQFLPLLLGWLIALSVNAGTRYDDCIVEYQELMSEAQREANRSSKPRGNLMSGKAAKIFNKAQRRSQRCYAMKK
jgi:hypothetical protein